MILSATWRRGPWSSPCPIPWIRKPGSSFRARPSSFRSGNPWCARSAGRCRSCGRPRNNLPSRPAFRPCRGPGLGGTPVVESSEAESIAVAFVQRLRSGDHQGIPAAFTALIHSRLDSASPRLPMMRSGYSLIVRNTRLGPAKTVSASAAPPNRSPSAAALCTPFTAASSSAETASGVCDVAISDCDFRSTDRGLRIKTRRGRGGTVGEHRHQGHAYDRPALPSRGKLLLLPRWSTGRLSDLQSEGSAGYGQDPAGTQYPRRAPLRHQLPRPTLTAGP